MSGTTTTQLRIHDVMSKHPVAVAPSMTLPELARTLDANEISGVPVVDSQDRVIGVVSKTDLVHHHLEQLDNPQEVPFPSSPDDEDMRRDEEEELAPASESISEKEATGIVESIMSTETVTASPDESLAVVARRMADEHVHRVIVTDEGGHLVGIVTSLDLLRHFPG